MAKQVWQFLLEIPCDKEEYVEYVEETAYYRNIHLFELTDAGLTEDEIFELQILWKQNLPIKIKKKYPTFTARQVENTIQLIFDCGSSFIYANDLFNSLENALLKEIGQPVFTEIFGLYPSIEQLN